MQQYYTNTYYKILLKKLLQGRIYFMENPWTWRGLTKLDDSFPFQRGQEDKFQETSRQKEIKVVI